MKSQPLRMTRTITVNPPVRLEAGVHYVIYPNWEEGTVAIDRVSESEWWAVNAGRLPGQAVRPTQDMTLTVVGEI